MHDCTMNRLFPAALTCQDKLSPETRGQHMWQPIGIGAVALATYDHPTVRHRTKHLNRPCPMRPGGRPGHRCRNVHRCIGVLAPVGAMRAAATQHRDEMSRDYAPKTAQTRPALPGPLEKRGCFGWLCGKTKTTKKPQGPLPNWYMPATPNPPNPGTVPYWDRPDKCRAREETRTVLCFLGRARGASTPLEEPCASHAVARGR